MAASRGSANEVTSTQRRRAFIIGYAPANERAPSPASLLRTTAATARGRVAHEHWSLGTSFRLVAPGDRLFLYRFNPEAGLHGLGTATSHPYETDEGHFVEVDWEILLPLNARLRPEQLPAVAPKTNWRLRGSGAPVDHRDIAAIERWFAKQNPRAIQRKVKRSAVEGSPVTRETTTYERSRRAREECIAFHGCACSVCDLDFGERYGKLGDGYIEVHHTTPIATKKKRYTLDPIKDLRPVCANCHAMLHRDRGMDPRSIESLRRSIRRRDRRQ